MAHGWDLLGCLDYNFGEDGYPREEVHAFIVDASSSFYSEFGQAITEEVDRWLDEKHANNPPQEGDDDAGGDATAGEIAAKRACEKKRGADLNLHSCQFPNRVWIPIHQMNQKRCLRIGSCPSLLPVLKRSRIRSKVASKDRA